MKLEFLETCNICGTDRLQMWDDRASISACQSCGYIFDNPRPTIQELIAFYSKPAKYDSWLLEEEARDVLWKWRLKQLLKFHKPGSLLDIGAGIGQFLSHARPFFDEVYGIEVSSTAIEIARHKYNMQLFGGDLEELDFRDQSVDNITIFHVLEHVPNPRTVIEKCWSLLTSGGTLMIAVPNDVMSVRAHFRRALRAMGSKRFERLGPSGLPKITLDGTLDEIHLSHFTPGVLQRLLKECGFVVVRNTLDRHYVVTGKAKLKEDIYYGSCRAIHTVSRRNLYDTILVIARK